MISREADSSSNISKASTAATTTATTTSSWSRLKDPRIVRVSRALGGKDRHSKVCTVRGLRDRRVRLSVPTAIQLYDLQERLGLNQPSKVVDWLLNAAKNEIDELPPLQIPQGIGFTQMLTNDQSWARSEEEKHEHDHDQYNHNTFLSRQNVTNATFDERWEPSNLTLSQAPISLGLNPHPHPHHHHHQQQQHEDLHAVYQITQPYFTSNVAAYDHRLHSAAPIRPVFNFNITADEQTKRGGDLHSS